MDIEKLIKKIRFRRSAQDHSRMGIGHSNDLRAWDLLIGNVYVGWVYNVSAYSLSRDQSRTWAVAFYANGYNKPNIMLKARFLEENVEDAKAFAVKTLTAILRNEGGKYQEFYDRIMNYQKDALK